MDILSSTKNEAVTQKDASNPTWNMTWCRSPRTSTRSSILPHMWGLLKMGDPQNHWSIIKNPIETDDLGVPHGTPISGNLHMVFFPMATIGRTWATLSHIAAPRPLICSPPVRSVMETSNQQVPQGNPPVNKQY